MILVSIKNAKPGDYLAKPILDENARILLKEGVLLTESYLLRINRLKISSIYIKKKYIEKILIDDVIKPESEIIGRNMVNDAMKPYLKSTGIIGGNIIDKIRNKKDVMNALADIKIMDYYTYQHSIQVAIFSIVLGVQLQLNQDELYVLCIGAMMHDIGKILIPNGLLLKSDTLTNEEVKTIKNHTINGYAYLKKLNIPEPARIIALHHHERVDGCGYPYNIKSKTISRFAKIVAIADVYDALTSERPYRKAISPNDALEYILSKSSTQFDYEMVKAFSKAIVPYPKGSLVTLSTGDIAIVTDVFRNFGLRPQVIIIKKGNNYNSLEIGETVSLMDHLDIVIENIEFIA